jgi:hypothetical protein
MIAARSPPKRDCDTVTVHIDRRAPRPGSSKYEYWNCGSFWNGFRRDLGAVSEMPVQNHDHLKKFVALYCNGSNNVVMRTAANPQGPWSSAQTLVTSTQIPGGLYTPFIHPWSTGRDLYFNLSLWSAYSVMLMHTTLAGVGVRRGSGLTHTIEHHGPDRDTRREH